MKVTGIDELIGELTGDHSNVTTDPAWTESLERALLLLAGGHRYLVGYIDQLEERLAKLETRESTRNDGEPGRRYR